MTYVLLELTRQSLILNSVLCYHLPSLMSSVAMACSAGERRLMTALALTVEPFAEEKMEKTKKY